MTYTIVEGKGGGAANVSPSLQEFNFFPCVTVSNVTTHISGKRYYLK